MEKNFNDIDHLFKEELGGYTEVPPPAVWDALEKRLKSEDKRRVFPYRWFWYVSIVSFILLLGSSIAWKMSRDNNSYVKLTSANGTATSIPQHAATTADNMPSANNSGNNKPTTSDHTTNTDLAGNTGEKNIQEEKNTTSRGNRFNRGNRAKQVQKQNSSKQTNDDLYADTEDDQYTVGGAPNRRNTQATDGQYVTDARKQHNIRVAETDPSQIEHENNYGSYAAVTSTNARTVSSAHYDIDMSSDDAAIGNSNTENQRSKNSNKPAQEQLYASTTKHVSTHKRSVANYVPSSAFADEPSNIARAKEKRHIANTRAPKENETKVAKNKAIQKTKLPITASTKTVSIAGKKNVETAAITNKQHKERTQNNIPQTSGINTVAVSTNGAKEKKNTQTVAPNTPSIKDSKEQTVSGPSQKLASSAPASHARKQIAEDKKTGAIKDETFVATSTPSVVAPASAPKPTTSRTKTVNITDTKTKPAIAATPTTQPAATKPASSDKRHTSKAEIAKGRDVITKTAALAAVPSGTQKHLPAKTTTHVGENTGGANTSSPIAKSKTTPGTKTTKHRTAQPVNTNGTEKLAGAPNGKSSATNTSVSKSHKQPTAEQKTGASSKPSITEPLPTEKNGTGELVATKINNTPNTVATKKSTEATKIDIADKTLADKGIAKNEPNKPKKGNRKNGRKSNSKTAAQPVVQQPVYMYSNSLLNRLPEDETVLADNLKVSSFTDKEPISSTASNEINAGTFKNDNGANNENTAAAGATADNNDSTTRHHLFSTKFEAGVKGGYETAFNGFGANKLVISPYLQYNLSDKFSILAQPSIKMSHVNNNHVGPDSNYNDRSHAAFTQTDSGAVYIVNIIGGNAVTIRNTLVNYNATYDSIVKSYGTRNTYMEIELPIMLKYKIGKGLSVYGGANGIYSKYSSIKEQTNHYTGTGHTITITPSGSPLPSPNANSLKLPGTPITKYTGPLYPEQKGGLLRMGYMLGFSYEYKKRWLFDVLMQQAMVKPHYEAGYNTNLPLSLPYFRFTLGYKLTK